MELESKSNSFVFVPIGFLNNVDILDDLEAERDLCIGAPVDLLLFLSDLRAVVDEDEDAVDEDAVVVVAGEAPPFLLEGTGNR